jgi:hypothetical protein
MKQWGAKIIAKKGLQPIYNNIPRSTEWLKVNCILDVVRGFLPCFYIFNMNMYGNANQGMDDFILIQRVFMIFKRLIASGIFNFIDTY